MSAPPAERVTQPSQGRSAGSANRVTGLGSMGDLCPDVIAAHLELKAAGQYVKPKQLQRLYDQLAANADVDFDFGGHVLTMLRRSGSVPVDRATGERVTNRLMRRN